MSSTDPTVGGIQLDALRRVQLTQTVESLRMAGDALAHLATLPDVSDPLGDIAAYTRTVNADLAALKVLGYEDRD